MDHYSRSVGNSGPTLTQSRPQMPPLPPPPSSNQGVGGATFFVDQKKGEINELKQVCGVLWQSTDVLLVHWKTDHSYQEFFELLKVS